MMDTLMYIMRAAKTQLRWQNAVYWILILVGFFTDSFTSFYVWGGWKFTPDRFWQGFAINAVGCACAFYGGWCIYKNWKEDDGSDD